VCDEIANQAGKPLKKREKKNHLFWNRIPGLVIFSSLVSSLCMSLRHAWSPLVVAEWEPGGVVIWEACRAGAGSTQGLGFLAGW
jgi:hypothetical protein